MQVQDTDVGNTNKILDVLRRLRPQDLVGVNKVRLGRPNDGGYVMLDLFNGIEAAYSIGINDDVSWDQAIVSRGIPVFQYDHTIENVPEQHPLMLWRKLGLHGEGHAAGDLITLARALEQNGHANARNLILKCDIEGFEWYVFETVSGALLNRFQQIVMEVHAFDYFAQAGVADRIMRSVANLSETHNLVHVHANNYALWTVVGGVPVPSVFEVTFARKDLGAFQPSHEIFPTALDMPCDPTKADYYLGRFSY